MDDDRLKVKWEGLWKSDSKDAYSGPIIKKSDIPDYSRLIVVPNKSYQKNSNRPKFVYCFAHSVSFAVNAEKLKPKKLIEIDGRFYTEENERLYTEEEVRVIMDGVFDDAINRVAYDPWDLLPDDYV